MSSDRKPAFYWLLIQFVTSGQHNMLQQSSLEQTFYEMCGIIQLKSADTEYSP